MDILNPSTYWIGSRCYRVLTHHIEPSQYNYTEQDSYPDDNVYNDEPSCGKDEENVDYDIERLSPNRYRTAWHIPSVYYSYLIGARGATKKRVEMESGTFITIPARGQAGDIMVTGSSVSRVRQGRLKLELLVEQARRKSQLTHFISVPFTQPSIIENFITFKAHALGKCGLSRGVSEKLFQDPLLLHLTVGVLTCADDTERHEAVAALHHVVSEAVGHYPTGSLHVRLQGLHYMNDDPSEVRILYAGVKDVNSVPQDATTRIGSTLPATDGCSNEMNKTDSADGTSTTGLDGSAREATTEPLDWTIEDADVVEKKIDHVYNLQNFVNEITTAMSNTGLLQKEKEKVLLHVTLLNTKFLLEDVDPDKPKENNHFVERPTFDARDILKDFLDFDFGVMEVREVHLSVFHSTVDKNGYYKSSTMVPLYPE